MICARCQCRLDPEDSHEHATGNLCDDCYTDVMNPAKACDPWATYTASRLGDQTLNPHQEAILALIAKQGPSSLEALRKATGLDQSYLERELAALRHMELIRAAPVAGGGKVILGFKDPDPQ